MMKKFKKCLLTFVAIISSIIYISSANALSENDTFSLSNGSTDVINNGVIYGNSKYNYECHYHSLSGYDAYCLDGAKKTGNAETYVVDRMLDEKNPIDAVILYIITADNYSYSSKVIAERAFLPFSGDASFTVGYANKQAYDVYGFFANYNSGYYWAAEKDSAIGSLIGYKYDGREIIADDLYKAFGRSSLIKYDSYDFSAKHKLNTDAATVAEAKKLFQEALEYGEKVAKNKNANGDKNIVLDAPVVSSEADYLSETSNNVTVRRIVRTLDFKATFTGFNDGTNQPVHLEINPDTTGFIKLESLSYNVVGTDIWVPFDKNTDLSSLMTSNLVTLNIKAKVSAIVTKEAQRSVTLSAKGTFSVKGTATGALITPKTNAVIDGTNELAFQRFYIGEKSSNEYIPSEVNQEFKYNWDGGDKRDYCTNPSESVQNMSNVSEFKEYMNDCCRPSDDNEFSIVKACDEAKAKNDQEGIDLYCTLKSTYCDYCNGTTTVPQTCAEFSEDTFLVTQDETASIKGPKDIAVCVIDYTDEAGNDYKVTNDDKLTSNSYCNVYCKEDYDLTLPTGKYAISGRFFELAMNVKGTKSCYTDAVDYEKFTKENNYLYTKILAGDTSKETIDAYNKTIRDIKACAAGWDDGYNFNPEINYSYTDLFENIDPGITKYGNDGYKFTKQYDKDLEETTKSVCAGNVNNEYTSCDGKSFEKSSDKTISINGFDCTSGTCKQTDITIPANFKFAKTVKTVSNMFAPEAIFKTNYTTGVVCTSAMKNKGECTKNFTQLLPGGVLPVSLSAQSANEVKTDKGIYQYSLQFKNIGEYYNKDKKDGLNQLGRLIGAKDAVTLTDSKDSKEFKGEYVCAYVVNCPECKVTCIEKPELGLYCELEEESCPECEVSCEGECAFDDDLGQLYAVHSISLIDTRLKDGDIGANFDNEKGKDLIKSIEDKGESIYEDPEYSFRFTPATINWVKNYNEGKTYIDDSLYVASNENGYNVYNSTFLDALEENNVDYIIKPLIESRESFQSYEKFCEANKDKGYNCGVVGTDFGPAWK